MIGRRWYRGAWQATASAKADEDANIVDQGGRWQAAKSRPARPAQFDGHSRTQQYKLVG